MLDPLNPLGSIFGRLGRVRQEDELRLADLNTLDPEREDSILSHVGNAVAGPLHVVGSALDTAGGTVRGALHSLLTGENPINGGFTGAFSWDYDKPGGRPSGRQLLRDVGLADQEDTWGNWLGGLATEIALDPMTYLTGGIHGAKTLAGGIAEKLGILDRTGEVGAKLAKAKLAAGATAKEVGSVAARTGGKIAGSRWARTNTTLKNLLDDAAERLPAEEVKRLRDLGETLARKEGTTLSALEGEKVGGLVGLGLPFGKKTAVGSMDTPILGGLADTMDKWGYRARWGNLHVPVGGLQSPIAPPGKGFMGLRLPLKSVDTGFSPGRALAAVFGPAMKGVYSMEGQLAARNARDLEDFYRASAYGKSFEAIRGAADLAKTGKLSQDELQDAIRYYTEYRPHPGIPGPLNLKGEIDANLAKFSPEEKAAFDKLVQEKMVAPHNVAYHEGTEAGMYRPEWVDLDVNQFPRHPGELPGHVGSARGRVFDMSLDAVMHRKKMFGEIPEGSVAIDRMGMDPNLVGQARLSNVRPTGPGPGTAISDAARHLMAKYGVTDNVQAEQLAQWFAQRPELGRVWGSPTRDLTNYMVRVGEQTAAGKTLMSELARNAQPLGPGVRSMEDVLKAGRFVDSADPKLLNMKAVENLGRQMGIKGATPRDILNELKNYGVRDDLANDLLKVIPQFQQPAALKPLGDAFDTLNNLFKAGVTSPWLAFHFRNRISGIIQNMIHGAYSWETERAAKKLLREGSVGAEHAAEAATWPAVQEVLKSRNITNPTEKEITDILQELSFKHEMIGKYQSMGHTGPGISSSFIDVIPGERPFSWGEKLSEFGQGIRTKEGRSLLNIRGVGGRTETENALFRLGEEAGYITEAQNRIAPFFEYLRQGYSGEEAARMVKEMHVDYSRRAFSGFENAIAKRAVPFYAYQRSMLAHTAKQLAAKPGGAMAQITRAENRMQGDNTVLPDYLAQGAAIPLEPILGPSEHGGPRVLGGLSLMHEPSLSFLGPALSILPNAIGGPRNAVGKDVRALLLEAGAQMNPAFKVPVEWAFNRSMFQRGPEGGRELGDQDPMVGRIIANLAGEKDASKVLPPLGEEVLANSPASRLLSTVRQTTDPRKWENYGIPILANQIAGLRVTDVDPRSQEAMLREQASSMLMDTGVGRSFETTTIPLEILKQLDPTKMQEAIELNAFLKILAKRAHARARGEKLQPIGQGPLLP